MCPHIHVDLVAPCCQSMATLKSSRWRILHLLLLRPNFVMVDLLVSTLLYQECRVWGVDM